MQTLMVQDEVVGDRRARWAGEWLRTGPLWPVCAGVCVVTALLVFVVPLFVPLPVMAVHSASYLAGFSNNFAKRAAVGISVLVLLWTMWRERARPVRVAAEGWEHERLPGEFVLAVVAISAAVLVACGALVTAAGERNMADAGYLIEQARVWQDTGRHLYTQVEFAYGPLLLWPEVWLSEALRCSMETAYYLTLAAESALGLLMVAYVLNALPIRGSLRKWALVLLALGALTPHLGLNYTYFRFVSAAATLVWGARRRTWWGCAAALAVGELAVLLISPEMGLALAAGVVVFSAVRVWQRGWLWGAPGVAATAVVVAALVSFGGPFLGMTKSFSAGALNLPVGPYPHVLVLLFALVWLVPVGLGRVVDLRAGQAAELLGLYVVGLAMMAAALGRCDPLHVVFDGCLMFALSLMLVSEVAAPMRWAWVGALALLMLWNHRVNEALFQFRTAAVLRQTVTPMLPARVKAGLARVLVRRQGDFGYWMLQPPDTPALLDTAALGHVVGSDPVATPMQIGVADEAALKATGHYSPGYFGYMMNVMSPASEDRCIRDVNAERWMLLPAKWDAFVETPQSVGMFQGMNLHYRQRKPMVYRPLEAFRHNVDENWVPVQPFGWLELYQRRDAVAAVNAQSEAAGKR